MTKAIGMPAARPFSTKGATEQEPVFVMRAAHLENWWGEMRRAGIDFGDHAWFEERDVIGFSAAEAEKLLADVNLAVAERTPSNTPHVHWLSLQDLPDLSDRVKAMLPADHRMSPAPVKTGEWENGDAKAYAYLASRILWPALRKEMRLSAIGGNYHAYETEGPFQILIYATPHREDAVTRMRPPDMVWGIPILCCNSAYQPKESDEKDRGSILLREKDYIVAELFPNAIYIHHHLNCRGKSDELQLFAEILKRAAQKISDAKEWRRFMAKIRRRQTLEREKALAALIDRSVKRRESRTADALKAAQGEAERLRTRYFAAERNVFALQAEAADPQTARASFLAEYEKLRSGKVGYVETVRLDPDRPHELHVFTKEITAKHPRSGRHYLFGRFEIVFDLQTGKIRIVNRDRTVEHAGWICHSPHVFERDGSRVCQGNIERELQAYLSHFEIEAAAVLTVSFLQSVKDDYSYTDRLELFPKAKKAAKP